MPAAGKPAGRSVGSVNSVVRLFEKNLVFSALICVLKNPES
jgi:hypothetical protein